MLSSYFSIKAGDDGVPLHDEIDKLICTICKKSFQQNALTQLTYSNICKSIMMKSAKIASKNNSRPKQKQVDILISENQALQIVYPKHHETS